MEECCDGALEVGQGNGVAGGEEALLLMAGGFTALSTVGIGTGYPQLLAGFLLLGGGTALAATPATTAIVSSLPPDKQGVASAVNDLTREVGGALGIAVLGSALIDRYHAGVAGVLAHAPAQLAHRADEALPAALAVAPRLGSNGDALVSHAQGAFGDGLGLAMVIAAAACATASVFVGVRAPARAQPESDARRRTNQADHPFVRRRASGAGR